MRKFFASFATVFLTFLAVQTDTDAASATGSFKAVITWQYNEYVGTKGDVGAKVVLFPDPPKKKIGVADKLAIGTIGMAIPIPDTDKLGLIMGQADGYGNAEFDDILPGRYIVLIISAKTTRNPEQPVDSNELDLLRPEFASAAALGKLVDPWLKVDKSDVELVTIRPGETTHLSHDFGNTYI